MRALWILMLSLVSLPASFAAYGQATEANPFQAELSHYARDEMAIVDRLSRLRQATEKLPEDWKSSMKVSGQILHKQGLLSEISEMEFSAAERWALLLQNLVTISRSESSLTAEEKRQRQELRELRSLHAQINSKLDRFNSQLKEGILLNLANKIQVSAGD